MIIDAHHHLWRFDPAQYAWIGAADTALRQDFGPAELDAACIEAGVDATIAVQARQTVDETRTLIAMARQTPRIVGVVGWVPLADENLAGIIDALDDPLLVGVRHVVQGEADPDFLLRPAIARGLDLIAARGLTYDLLLRAAQLPQAVAGVDAHPDLRFVLDHAGKPDFTQGLEPWAGWIRELARRPNVCCKLSGLATEMGPVWTPDRLRPWVDILLEAFGPGRLMFGSDWPVCLLASGYRRWFDAVRTLLSNLSAHERAQVLGGNAQLFYNFTVRESLETSR